MSHICTKKSRLKPSAVDLPLKMANKYSQLVLKKIYDPTLSFSIYNKN